MQLIISLATKASLDRAIYPASVICAESQYGFPWLKISNEPNYLKNVKTAASMDHFD